MKPLKLTLEGLTAFRRRSEIDFRSLRLFAITGPTGSGKSSLLDAITLALYGEVERVGRRIDDLITHGEHRLTVELEFEVGGRQFRVSRSRRRTGKGEAILEELTLKQPRFLASGVRAVDQKIRELVGLPYEAFVQAALLPQGAFARFLQSEPKKRREILRQLLRLQCYKKMQELASSKRRTLEQQCRDLRSRLAEDYADATESHLKKLEQVLSKVRREERVLGEELQKKRETYKELEARYQKAQQCLALKKQLETLDALSSEIEAKRERLKQAERAQQIWSLLELAHDAERRKQEAERALEETEACYRRIEREDRQARERLQRASEQAAELDRLREKWQKLGEIEGLLDVRDSFRRKRQRLEETVTVLEREISHLNEAFEAEKLSRLQEEIAAVEQALTDLAFDETLFERLEHHLKDALTLQERQEELQAFEEFRTKLRQAQALALSLFQEAEQQWTQIKERLEHHRLELAASMLRRELKTGDLCPVCLQKVRQLPLEFSEAVAGIPPTSVEELERRFEEAQQALEAARKEKERIDWQLAAKEEEIERLRSEIEHLTDRLKAAFPELPSPLEEAVLENYRTLSKKRQQRDRLAQQLEILRAQLRQLETQKQELNSRLAERDHAAHELEELTTQLREIEQKIGTVTDHDDPKAERQALKAKIDALGTELIQAQRAFEEANRKLARLAAERELKKAQLEREQHAAQARWQKVERALKTHGFGAVSEVEAAYLPPQEIDQLRQEVEDFLRKRLQFNEQIVALEREIGSTPPTDEDYRRARSELETVENRLRKLGEQRAVLEREIQKLGQRIESAKMLKKQLMEAEREFRRYHQLAEDLRDDRFQEFLLNELFGELVAGASHRLFEMTGRYRLDYGEGSFFVVDEEHGGERRRAETLSGGETFLASLALALELSEQVCRHAGGVVLESLFIDEGFGTLDPEALDKVATTLEGLLETGRMVGVITHLTELAERLPARIVIERRPSGSVLRVVQ